MEKKIRKANGKPNLHQDIQASRDRKKPDNDTTESCLCLLKNKKNVTIF